MELTGKVIYILPTQSGQGKSGEWTKNSFVIEWVDNVYTSKLCLEVMGADKWDKMKDAVKVGNEVLCRFSVSSREWNGRWFTGCQCYYCASIGGQAQSQQPATNPQPQTSIQGNQYEDVPF